MGDMSFVKKLATKKRPYQTVFSVSGLTQSVEGYQGKKLNSALKYAVGHGDLVRITRGIYAFDIHYSKAELANKYISPSYISFYTALVKWGIVFQPYDSIYLACRRSQTVEIDGQQYMYRKIKDEILLNPLGILTIDGVSWASMERAICDTLYLDGDEFFDNLRTINWDLMKRLHTNVYANNQVIGGFIAKNSI